MNNKVMEIDVGQSRIDRSNKSFGEAMGKKLRIVRVEDTKRAPAPEQKPVRTGPMVTTKDGDISDTEFVQRFGSPDALKELRVKIEAERAARGKTILLRCDKCGNRQRGPATWETRYPELSQRPCPRCNALGRPDKGHMEFVRGKKATDKWLAEEAESSKRMAAKLAEVEKIRVAEQKKKELLGG